MTRGIWRLRQIARRLGATGLLGLALCLAAGALWREGVVPTQDHVAAETAEWQAAASRPITKPAPTPAGPAAWVAELPRANAIPTLTGQLAGLAHDQGIQLEEGRYAMSPVEGTSLSRWRARIPVEASYPALKRFLASSLARMPALTLDGFKLERADTSSPTLDAELRFSVYVRSGA
ncbi:MAG: GspMb/PilO family protein [Betaproteobacteria bacterium]|nr:GspMb/PilO family protein [Betaproteobacteria bacterium]